MKKRVTIKDIANQCGVSATTVSRVVNNVEGYCGIDTEKKIRDAIEELGYYPNPNARSLVTNKTNMIAVIIPDICNFFFQEFSKSVEIVCNKKGYRLLLCSSEGSVKKESSYLASLSHGVVDGIIVTTQNVEENNDEILRLFDEKFPIITVERYGEELKDVPSVTLNNAEGIKFAVEELYKNGHRKIAYIGGPVHAANSRLREQGYIEALQELGIPFNKNLMCKGDYKLESGIENMNKLLKKEKFTAVVAANDLMAIGACKAIRQAGMQVPDDISVFGFDGTILAELHQPSLSTVMIHGADMGRIAAETLIKLIDGGKKVETKISVHSDLIRGESVAAI